MRVVVSGAYQDPTTFSRACLARKLARILSRSTRPALLCVMLKPGLARMRQRTPPSMSMSTGRGKTSVCHNCCNVLPKIASVRRPFLRIAAPRRASNRRPVSSGTLILELPCRFPGYTIIEVLVVLALLAIITGLIFAGIQRARVAAARAACASNLRQVSFGIHSFETAHQNFPKGCDEGHSRARVDTPTPVGLSWQTSILPFVEQAPLWAQVERAHREDPRGHSPAHGALCGAVVQLYVCPADGRGAMTDGFGESYGVTNYRGVAGTGIRADDGVFHIDLRIRPTDVTDGLSNTAMIGERPSGPQGAYGGWYASWGLQRCPLAQILPAGYNGWIPSDATGCRVSISSFLPGKPDSLCSVGHFWSLHTGGANFAFADGSVRFLRYDAAGILPALATRAGGEAESFPE